MLATAIIAITTATTRKDAVSQLLLLLLLLRPQRRVPIVNKQMRSNFSFRNVSTVAKASNGELPPVTETTADSVKWPKCSHYREGKGGGKVYVRKSWATPTTTTAIAYHFRSAMVVVVAVEDTLTHQCQLLKQKTTWTAAGPGISAAIGHLSSLLSDHVSYRAHTHTLTHSAHNFLSGCDSLRPVTLIKEHSS